MTKILIEAHVIGRHYVPSEEHIRKQISETLANCYGADMVIMQPLNISGVYIDEFRKDPKTKLQIKK